MGSADKGGEAWEEEGGGTGGGGGVAGVRIFGDEYVALTPGEFLEEAARASNVTDFVNPEKLVCMYVYTYVYVCMYVIRIYTYVYVCMYVYVHMHVCMYIYKYIRSMYVCIYTLVYTYVCLYVYTSMLIVGSLRFFGTPKITITNTRLQQVFPNQTFWFLFSLLSLTIVLSIVLSMIVGKMKPKSSVWKNLW